MPEYPRVPEEAEGEIIWEEEEDEDLKSGIPGIDAWEVDSDMDDREDGDDGVWEVERRRKGKRVVGGHCLQGSNGRISRGVHRSRLVRKVL